MKIRHIVAIFIAVVIVVLYWQSCHALNTLQKRLRLLQDNVIAALNKSGLQYWADYGTLLGIIREADVIYGDNDADFCIANTEANHAAMYQITQYLPFDYVLKILPNKSYRIFSNKVRFPFVDIYTCEQVYDGIRIDPAEIPMPIAFVKELIHVPYHGQLVSIPKRYIEVLEWRYGSNWHIPIPGYKGDKDSRTNYFSLMRFLPHARCFSAPSER